MTADNTQRFALINDLIASAHLNGGVPQLRAEDRDELLALLRRAVVNRDELDALVGYLKRQTGLRDLRQSALSEETMEPVLRGGLEMLDNPALAALALDPVGLYLLAAEVNECLPTAWREEQRQDGLRDLRGRGVALPDFGAMLAEVGVDRRGARVGALEGAESTADGPVPACAARFEVRSADYQWLEGTPVAAPPTVVDVAWYADGRLSVAMAGFLGTGPGNAASVTWRPVGGAAVVGELPRGENGPLTLTGVARRPEPGDRLELEHAYASRYGAARKIRVALTWTKGQVSPV